VEDITAAVDAQCEREAIEARLRLSERLESLGELAAGIAHDFNNVLLVIMSYNEFIEDDLQSISIDRAAHARLVKNAEAVRLAADRAAGLTHRLLIFARRGLAAPELIDLNDAVRGALALLAGTIGARVRLIDNLDTAAHLVMADRTQLEQVAVNLVVNARDAIGLHGRIVVSSAAITLDASAVASHVGLVPGQYTRLTVSDDGAGIPPEVVSRVFEPFFTTKLSDQGTGLGLATVYGIARSLGGDVTITSGPGRGTEVQLLVPLAATGPAGPAGTARGRSADGPRESPEV
jgi:signal transduction histidine kinase